MDFDLFVVYQLCQLYYDDDDDENFLWLIFFVSLKNGYGEIVESCDKKCQVGLVNFMDKNVMVQ